MAKSIDTRKGRINFPAFFPVTTFGKKFPLDEAIRPHLYRFAPALMVSYHYAQQMTKSPDIPLFIDSGGFASLFKESEIVDIGKSAYIRTKEGTIIQPAQILAFQEKHAEAGATLDFLIPPGCSREEALRRQELTIRNAIWAVQHRSRKDFRLYASVQAWDPDSARNIMLEFAGFPFDGFALGGMVPLISRPELIFEIVRAIRDVEPDRPLHVYGIGLPMVIRGLFEAGADSVDSSSFVRHAAGKKFMDPETGIYRDLVSPDASGCCCRFCQIFEKAYYAMEGELNTMALALHNLEASLQLIFY